MITRVCPSPVLGIQKVVLTVLFPMIYRYMHLLKIIVKVSDRNLCLNLSEHQTNIIIIFESSNLYGAGRTKLTPDPLSKVTAVTVLPKWLPSKKLEK